MRNRSAWDCSSGVTSQATGQVRPVGVLDDGGREGGGGLTLRESPRAKALLAPVTPGRVSCAFFRGIFFLNFKS